MIITVRTPRSAAAKESISVRSSFQGSAVPSAPAASLTRGMLRHWGCPTKAKGRPFL